MISKTHLTCSNCRKIFIDPIKLPCDHSICSHHINNANALIHKQIKCVDCCQIFDAFKAKEFESNTLLKEYLINESYLSDEEKCLRQQMESFLNEFFKQFDQFMASKNDLDLNCFNFFQELRFRIDLHREITPKVYTISLFNHIYQTAFEMIEQIQSYEKWFINEINSKLFVSFKSLEEEMTCLNETFRDPNLTIEKLKQMILKQNEAMLDLKSKIKEVNNFKEHFKTNMFIPCFDWIDFGQLYLFKYPTHFDPFKSQILSCAQALQMLVLCEFSLDQNWSLLYRASRDGFDARCFHSKCDRHSSTLIILKAKETQFIFGGYTDTSWDYNGWHKWDPRAFIFSLTNKENKPCKMNTTDADTSIFTRSSSGPSFGAGDFVLSENPSKNRISCSNLGVTYAHDDYVKGSDEARSFLAGTYQFQLSEIEVYEKENEKKHELNSI